MNSALRRFFFKPWLREMLLAVLLLQSLVPAGFMPGVDVDGRATLKLCSLADVSLLQSSDAQRSGGGGDTSGQAEQGPCLFAATVCAIAPPAALHQGPMCPHVLTVPPIQGAQSYSSFTPLARLPRGPPAQV